MSEEERIEIWAVLELMGHVKLAGKVSQEEMFGAKMGRIEIPNGEGGFTTQFFGGGSVYRMTPVSEEVARAVAANHKPQPISPWELPKNLLAPPSRVSVETWEQTMDDEDTA